MKRVKHVKHVIRKTLTDSIHVIVHNNYLLLNEFSTTVFFLFIFKEYLIEE